MAKRKSPAPAEAQTDDGQTRLKRHLQGMHSLAMELAALTHVISEDFSGVDTAILGGIAERLASELNEGLDAIELGCVMEGRERTPAPSPAEAQS